MNMNERYKDYIPKQNQDNMGKILKEKRKSMQLTIKDVAKKIGMTYQQLWQIEEGAQNASIFTLESIAKFYSIPMQTIIRLNFKNSAAYKNYLKLMKEYAGK